MAIGDLVIRMSADLATLQADLGRAAHMADRFANNINRVLGGIGVGLSATAFASFIKGSIDAADRLNDLRTRTGLTGQELLTLEGAAVRSGVGLEVVSDVTSKLGKRLGAAVKETGEAASAYEAMGIKVTKAGGGLKNIGEILREVGAKFKTYEDGADKGVLATAALGKGGDKLIPVVEALRETEERFKRLGITIDEDFIGAADKLKDTLEDLHSVNQVLSRQIADALIPYLQQFTEAMIEASKATSGMQVAADAVVIPLKVMITGFLTLTTTIAAAGDVLVGFAISQEELKKGNIKRAFEEMAFGAESAKARIDGLAGIITKLWQDAKPPQELRDIWDEGQRALPKGRAPGIPDQAKLKSANDALLRLMEERTKLQLDALQAAAQREDALLEAKHSNNLVGEKEYWSRKLGIQKEALDAELKVLNAQIERQRAEVSKQPKGSAEQLNAQKELEQSEAKRNALGEKFASTAEVSYLLAQRAAKEYAAAVEDLNIQLLELQGFEVEAAARRFEASTKDRRERLAVNLDSAALRTLDNVRELSRAQAEFNGLKEEQGRITARLSLEEERINNDIRVGAISQFGGMQKLGDARARAVLQLEEIVKRQKEIAEESKNPTLQLQAEQAEAALKSLSTQVDLTAQHISTTFVDSFADAFADFIMGTKSAAEAFRAFANSVIRELVRIAAQEAATKAFGQGSAFYSAIAAVFGSGSGAGSAGSAGAGDIPSTLSYAQYGAFATAGQPFIVGEAGPELFVPGSAGEIVPNGQLGGDRFYVTINANDAQSFAAMMATEQGRRVITSTVRRANHRSGRSAGF